MKDPNSEPTLSDEEIAYMRWLENPQNHPGSVPSAWTQAQQAFQPILSDLKRAMPTPLEPPYPEFFNNQLMHRLAEETPKTTETQVATFSLWERLHQWIFGSSRGWAWGAVGATAAIVCFSWLGQQTNRASDHTAIISAYSPELGKIPPIEFSKEAQAIIIDLQDLEAYPAERAIIGMVGDEAKTLIASAAAQ